MEEGKYIKNTQKLIVGSSAIIIMLLSFLWIRSGTEPWKKYQKEYFSLNQRMSDSLGIKLNDKEIIGIHEINLASFDRKDRCISCHNGMENPLMGIALQPHTSHPGNLLDTHPVDEFGCTICHGGQGRAMNKKDAFGLAPDTHWPQPILFQPYIQSSCGKCHLSIFQIEKPLAGTEVFMDGRDIFAAEGCLGCHKARGLGGIIGPDLTEQGEKTRHEYSFQNVLGEQTVSNWLKKHFVDPEMVSPGSKMLRIDLPEEELEALATFVMGLAKPDIPVSYFSIGMLQELKGKRDTLYPQSLYSFSCSSCHGKSGDGKSYLEYNNGVPAIMNHDFLRLASNDFILFTILHGRSRRQMASWETNISGFWPAELVYLNFYLKNLLPSLPDMSEIRKGNGNEMAGKFLFDKNCQTCHGKDGTGDLATSLNKPDFLKRASNEFIAETIIRGRGNTAMPGWPDLSVPEIRDILAYFRSWKEAGYLPFEIEFQNTKPGNRRKPLPF